ncbi:MAG TPA: citrate/2-methylcitrate synthase [Dehalococcoidia bacterium]|nr:citrate/2-methylcitrate synthase [Dehalococcoidia bacterium]
MKAGLEGVVVTTSAITEVDGEAGRLYYRGYPIEHVAEGTFEETWYLLHHGERPTTSQLTELTSALTSSGRVPAWLDDLFSRLPKSAHPLAVLREAIAMDSLLSSDVEAMDPETNYRKSIRLTALFPVVVARWDRYRKGLSSIEPRSDLGHGASFLWMLHGVEPSADQVRAMDVALVLHADHEFNASTFVARAVAGTEADLHSAVIAALAALKGPKHGGANEDVVQMLDEIGSPERAEDWVKARIAWRETLPPEERQSIRARFPGFGHRVYKVDDPRGDILREMARRLAEEKDFFADYEMAEKVREVVQREKGLPVNVDYYSALVYRALDIQADLCLSIFAISRVAGWTAHIIEQLGNNRLIRPRSEYIGPEPRRLEPVAV